MVILMLSLMLSALPIEGNAFTKAENGKLSIAALKALPHAKAFSQETGITIYRHKLPSRIIACDGPSGVARATGLSTSDRLGEVVARVTMVRGVVFLGRPRTDDLYVELGKWFFYEPDYKWGKDLEQDRKHLDMAERFAEFCAKRDRK